MFFKPLELHGSDLSGKAKSFMPSEFFYEKLEKLKYFKTSTFEFKFAVLFISYLFIRLHSIGIALLLRNLVNYSTNKKNPFSEDSFYLADTLSYKNLPFTDILENEEVFFKTFDKLVFFINTFENKKTIISPSELFDWVPPLLLYKHFCQHNPKIQGVGWYFLFLSNSFESFKTLISLFDSTLFDTKVFDELYEGFIKLTLEDLIKDDLISFMSFYYYFNKIVYSQILTNNLFSNQIVIKESLEKKVNREISLFFNNNLSQTTNWEFFFDKKFKPNFEEVTKSLNIRNRNSGIPITLWLHMFTENFEIEDISYIFGDNVASAKTLSSISPLFFYFIFKE